ncbi:MAG: 30S ribosomal protein S6 [Deltaproteobacteria bacterium]|nr:30S ribosomal protein S6 [Deltaproteobacteria bacterium]MBN2670091.1 30S ribosomal protein S6 [Deltaproteobacteria bacterium]
MTQVLPKERAREYESIFILHPDSHSDVVDNIAGRCQDIISRLDGKLLRAENWGRRRLAYPVKKNQKGIYIYLKYLGYQNLVHELERNFRAIDSIIKFLSVKIDEDVNPDARPIAESDISFVSTFIEPEEVEEAAPASVDAAEETADAAPEAAESAEATDAADETQDDAPAEEATDADAADDSAEEEEK